MGRIVKNRPVRLPGTDGVYCVTLAARLGSKRGRETAVLRYMVHSKHWFQLQAAGGDQIGCADRIALQQGGKEKVLVAYRNATLPQRRLAGANAEEMYAGI